MIQKLKALDYRHYICIAITAVSLGVGFLFPNSIPRAAEAVRDLLTSIAYYFCELILEENPIPATVTSMPAWEFAPSRWEPLQIFPWTWEEFKALWPIYWDTFFSLRNFLGYLIEVVNDLYLFSQFLMMEMPLFWVIVIYLKQYTATTNNDYDKDSKHSLSHYT